MRIPIYQVDAFTNRACGGNPAAVCPLEGWIPDATMQAIAAENNLSETAFFVPDGDGYLLRWFTPTTEVEICGHATLASAYVVFRFLSRERERVDFRTLKVGTLIVRRMGEELAMDFPARPLQPAGPYPALAEALGKAPIEVHDGWARLALYEHASEVEALAPDFGAVARLDRINVIATARGGSGIDFVSRFFAPAKGIPEDPVTGGAHCALAPFWAERLGKSRLRARQVSKRLGDLYCEHRGERVTIAGKAAFYMQGAIEI